MARDKLHVIRIASAERIDLFRPEVTRRARGAVEIRGGAHCSPRLDGRDHYAPVELWVVEPGRLDAARAVVRQIEGMLSACTGDDEFALARARDAVNVAMTEEMQRVMKGAMRLDTWLDQGRPV
jgi:hypothetical protein